MRLDDARKLLPDYIEGNLDRQTTQQLQMLMENSPELQIDYRIMCELDQASQSWVNERVPAWKPRVGPKPQRQFLAPYFNWASLAFSTMAFVLVIFQMQISFSGNDFTVSFGLQSGRSVDSEYFAEQLNQWSTMQQNYIDARLVEFNLQQERNMRNILATVKQHGEEQRRSDLKLLTRYLKNSMNNEKLNYDLRLQALEDLQVVDRSMIQLQLSSLRENQGGL